MIVKDRSTSLASVWLSATRPRTLPAAVSPVILGSALAYRAGSFRPLPAALCLGFALLSQIAANFANDYFDFKKGADTAARTGPRRAVASGLISPRAMRRATMFVCIAAFLVGLGLLPYGGWPLLVIGLSSIVCAVAYTGGPFPLAYLGLGDCFVFLFFGLIAVCATAFVQSGSFNASWLIAGAALGGLTTNILLVNNYRDVETDAPAGKRTLVVRFGRGYARVQFLSAHLLSLAAPFVLARLLHLPLLWLPLLLLPFAAWAFAQHRRLRKCTDPRDLVPLIGICGFHLAAYSVALSAWLVLG